jgi:prepilin signal peptidase PulO-like enzyme (type II secretory pathway)
VSALLPALMYRSGALGLGDVKLFAAVGAACGAFVGLYAQTYAYVAAMVPALVLAVRRGKVRTTLSNVRKVLAGGRPVAARSEGSSPGDGFTEIPLGPAIFIGMCAAAWARWRAG